MLFCAQTNTGTCKMDKVTVLIVCVLVCSLPIYIAAVELGGDCSADANSCTDPNAGCVSEKCECNSDYKVDGTACVAKELGDDCTDANDCKHVATAVCTSDKCSCPAGSYPGSNGKCQLAVSETTCSANGKECEEIENADCDTTEDVMKCKCNDGYTENNNVCQAENGAASTMTLTGMVFFPLIVLLVDALFM